MNQRRLQTNLLVGLCISIIFLTRHVQAQQPGPGSPGIVPFGTYVPHDLFNIDLVSGNIAGSIPLASYAQKGAFPPFDYLVSINNPQFTQREACEESSDTCFLILDLGSPIASGAQYQTSYSWGGIEAINSVIDGYYTLTDDLATYDFDLAQMYYSVYDATGAKHNLLFDATNPLILRAQDGTGYKLQFPPGSNTYDLINFATPVTPATAAILTDANGITASAPSYPSCQSASGGCVAQYTDPRGNTLTIGSSGVTDTVQRSLPYNNWPEGDITKCPNLGHAEQPVTEAFMLNLPGNDGTPTPIELCYTAFTYHLSFDTASNSTYDESFPQLAVTAPTDPDDSSLGIADNYGEAFNIQSIVLPTGEYWGFVYDASVITLLDQDFYGTVAYGTIKKILYPTGGSASFTYDTFLNSEYMFPSPSANGNPWYYAVASIQMNDGTLDLPAEKYHWITSPIVEGPGDNDYQNLVAIRQDSAGDETQHTFTNTGGGFYETEEDIYQGVVGSTLLQSTTTRYTSEPTITGRVSPPLTNVRPVQVSQSTDGIASIQQSNQYSTLFTGKQIACLTGLGYYDCSIDPGADSNQYPIDNTSIIVSTVQPTETERTDLATGLLTASTNTPFWINHSAYAAANLLNLPGEVEVTSTPCGTCSPIVYSNTTYSYDDTNLGPAGVIGNLTTVQRQLSNLPTGGQSSASGSVSQISTTYHYNSANVLDQIEDPLGHLSVITTTQCHDLYPLSVTTAYQSTTTLPETTTTTKDCYTGAVTGAVDANGVSNSYDYSDPLGRLVAAKTAIGTLTETWTTYAYPSLNRVDVSQDLSAKGDGLLHQTSIYDGLGRAITNISASGAEVNTTYNGTGQVYTVSNPHLASASTSDGTTYYTYDALGRETVVLEEDGTSKRQRCYGNLQTTGQANCHAKISSFGAGDWVDVSDETGNTNQQGIDSSGKALSIVEPGGPETDYSYDVLGNLTSITQHGMNTDSARIRSFQYDSLSRLITSTNPETGTICYGLWSGGTPGSGICQYGYDANGNLLYKTDARGVTANYTYDSLNRLTGKSYIVPASASTTVFPADPVTFIYDVNPAISVTNGIGRLVSEYTGSASAPSTERSISAYDAMGRIVTEQQCGAVAICGASPYSFQYTYDLAGNLTSSGNGLSSTNIGLTNSYDGAGRLAMVTSTWDDATHPATLFGPPASGAQYGPVGLTNASLGIFSSSNQAAFSQLRTYDNRMRVTGETDTASVIAGSPATGSVGTVTISGTEGSTQQNATPAQGWISIYGGDGGTMCVRTQRNCVPTSDSGTVTVTLVSQPTGAAFTAVVEYDGEDNLTLASELTQALTQQDPFGNNPMVSATFGAGPTVAGHSPSGVVTLTSLASGSVSNYQITLGFSDSEDYSGSSAATTLTGGTDGGIVSDSGTVALNIYGSPVSVAWQGGSSVQTILAQMASALQGTNLVSVTETGSSLTLSSVATGAASDVALTCSATDTANQTPSFSISCNGMSGGSSAQASGPGIVYSYSIPAPTSTTGYAPNGNLLSMTDSVMGAWNYQYDNLNRLTQAAVNSGTYTGSNISGATLGWSYDSFGNRLLQTSTSLTLPNQSLQYSSSDNRVLGVGLAANANTSISTLQYDLSGNNIGKNGYVTNAFDAEGRLCATLNGDGGYTQYLYDAEGRRVAKAAVNTLTCNYSDPTFQLRSLYLRNLNGDEVTELDGTGAWVHSNAYSAGKMLATYDSSGLHFHFTDWLGTHRVQASATGTIEEVCQSLPYGDALSCSGSSTVEKHHFTGKERDAETGLDYFGARYYASNMGRWMSPDSINVTEDRMMNPSSTLNKYAYGANNPLKYTDPDGKDITIFYEAANPFTGSPGHTMLLAYNQQTGDSAVRSFGPDYANGASVMGTITGTPGTDSFGFANIKSPDDLRANFSSITIQTYPEEAQQVINEIRAHPDGNYSILDNNCTTTCSRLLRSIGKTKSHALYPGAFFDALYDQYGHPHATGRLMPHVFKNGATYGNLRPGYNPFQLFFNDIPQQHEKVTVTIKTTDGQVIQ